MALVHREYEALGSIDYVLPMAPQQKNDMCGVLADQCMGMPMAQRPTHLSAIIGLPQIIQVVRP